MKTRSIFAVVVAALALSVAGCERAAPAPAPGAGAPKPAAPSTPASTTPAPATPGATSPAAAAGTPQAATPAASASGTIVAGDVSFTIPAGWKQVPPANSMRLAELQVPDESGDVTKVSTVAFSSAGGDVAGNVARWAGQMKDASGQPPKADIATRTAGGFKVSTVEMSGTYAGMGDTAPRPDWMLRGAIVETPGGLIFVKMTGPASSMKTSAAGWNALIDSIRKP